MQVKGKNFLIPVDADIQSEDEVPYRGIDANELLCQDGECQKPCQPRDSRRLPQQPLRQKLRSSAQGLAQMDAPVGTLVAFATAPGSVAADGTGRNGLYTLHLLASLNQPGLKIEDVFKRVRVGVRQGSRGKQIPWENTSLEGDFYFKPGKPGEAPTQLASLAPALAPSPLPARQERARPGPTPPPAWSSFGCPAAVSRWAVPTYEKDRTKYERQQDVCVEGFWLGKYEVTVGQYKKLRPDHGDSDDKLPVNKVSWQDAIGFAAWLSEKSGMKNPPAHRG